MSRRDEKSQEIYSGFARDGNTRLGSSYAHLPIAQNEWEELGRVLHKEGCEGGNKDMWWRGSSLRFCFEDFLIERLNGIKGVYARGDSYSFRA
jgi:hypothetical protein